MAKKVRLDDLLVEKGLAANRKAAQALILAGKVRAPGVVPLKPGQTVLPDQAVERVEENPFVSRGGLKLQGALDAFGIEVEGRSCVDIGASTGGFTDCLLQRGAARVLAVDVGHGQLDWKLRNDARVENREKTHVLSLGPGAWGPDGSGAGPKLGVVDVSFISLERVLPHLGQTVPPGTELVVLVKPQFEADPKTSAGGVVRRERDRLGVLAGLSRQLSNWGFEKRGESNAVIRGPKGNQETFLHLIKSQQE